MNLKSQLYDLHFSDDSELQDDTGDDAKSVRTNDDSKKWVEIIIQSNFSNFIFYFYIVV